MQIIYDSWVCVIFVVVKEPSFIIGVGLTPPRDTNVSNPNINSKVHTNYLHMKQRKEESSLRQLEEEENKTDQELEMVGTSM